MSIHPIIESPQRWIPALLLLLVAVVVHTTLLMGYGGALLLPAAIDGLVAVGLLGALAYFAWYVIGFVSLLQTDVVASVFALLFWLAGGFFVQQLLEEVVGAVYTPFLTTLPFRLLAGMLCWAVVMLWYRLQSMQHANIAAEDAAEEREMKLESTSAMEQSEAMIDRITVKDGSRIHLISTCDLLYVEACGDYVTLVTSEGQYIKEQTMKYLETHLPAAGFVRVHRSIIVNVTQISRVELFGKENYRLLLKNGAKLRVSHSGYRLLKERLAL